MIVTRFAPTIFPKTCLHVGHLMNIVINAAYAWRNGGHFWIKADIHKTLPKYTRIDNFVLGMRYEFTNHVGIDSFDTLFILGNMFPDTPIITQFLNLDLLTMMLEKKYPGLFSQLNFSDNVGAGVMLDLIMGTNCFIRGRDLLDCDFSILEQAYEKAEVEFESYFIPVLLDTRGNKVISYTWSMTNLKTLLCGHDFEPFSGMQDDGKFDYGQILLAGVEYTLHEFNGEIDLRKLENKSDVKFDRDIFNDICRKVRAIEPADARVQAIKLLRGDAIIK